MKITKMTDKNIAEFNYKLLHKLLNNNLNASKWNENVQMFCEKLFGSTIIIIGFNETSDINDSMITLISFVALKIYKYKMKCKLDNISNTNDSLYNSFKMSLNTYQYIVENSYENIQRYKLFINTFKLM